MDAWTKNKARLDYPQRAARVSLDAPVLTKLNRIGRIAAIHCALGSLPGMSRNPARAAAERCA